MRGTRAILRDTRLLISASRATVTTTFKSLDRTLELISRSRRILGVREGSELDRALALQRLQQAEEYIVEGEHHISRQRRVIADLERDGHDTVLASELLETLEATLANHVALRERLVAELRQENAARK